MGIGWRNFVARFRDLEGHPESITGSVRAGDLYVNWIHGIAFEKPHGWEFQDPKATGRVKERLLPEIDRVTPDLWRASLRTYPEYGDFIVAGDVRNGVLPAAATAAEIMVAPGIAVCFQGTWEEREEGVPFSLARYVEGDLRILGEAYRHFRVVVMPHEHSISRCPGIEYTTKFSVVHQDLEEPVRMRVRTLNLFQDPAIYAVSMFDYPDNDPPLTFRFNPVLAGIVVA